VGCHFRDNKILKGYLPSTQKFGNIITDTRQGLLELAVLFLKELEVERNRLLLKDKITWRQRCRANWLKSGDLNTKKIHKYASACRRKNNIWEITSEDGTIHKGQHALKDATIKHFQPFFEHNTSANLQSQVSVARLFHTQFRGKMHFFLIGLAHYRKFQLL
jgi:hypothetical protein